ncbi:acetylornithine deacetylase [Salinisphaera hydrothermalis]|uniref:acetylornithine deacetylase n=1 Tax=Salinisphaera hydrothermalis TaxID=563188 RepID=UPI003342D1A0
MTPTDILGRLLSFKAVAGQPNAAITGWVGEHLEHAGARVTRISGPDVGRDNLWASFGPCDQPGLVLSGHLDVVPAEADMWTSDPFELVERDGCLFGRGTSDMQGYVACVLALADEIAASAITQPIHVALSCDEELGCRGVPYLLTRLPELCAPPWGAVIGEPTSLVPVRGHKGKAAYALEVIGRAGHSSRTDLGRNAIHGLSQVLTVIVETARALEHGPLADDFIPAYSTLQAGVIQGGQALNIIPDHARLEVEARAIPGVDPDVLLAPILDALSTLERAGFETRHQRLSRYPALQIERGHRLVDLVSASAGHSPKDAVSFGTEAGLFQQAGIPAIICGPGDIDRAHKADEYITAAELADCTRFLRELIQAPGPA